MKMIKKSIKKDTNKIKKNSIIMEYQKNTNVSKTSQENNSKQLHMAMIKKYLKKGIYPQEKYKKLLII